MTQNRIKVGDIVQLKEGKEEGQVESWYKDTAKVLWVSNTRTYVAISRLIKLTTNNKPKSLESRVYILQQDVRALNKVNDSKTRQLHRLEKELRQRTQDLKDMYELWRTA